VPLSSWESGTEEGQERRKIWHNITDLIESIVTTTVSVIENKSKLRKHK
jgi:hypothetical protein